MLLRIVLMLLMLAAIPSVARAQGRGVRLSRDDNAILVQKDVGGECWAINASLRVLDPLTLSGTDRVHHRSLGDDRGAPCRGCGDSR